MSKCVVIVGKTASGKTSLARCLEMKGFRRIVTYTTRKPRPNEINSIDYHFLTEEEFKEKEASGFFAETSTTGNDRYGSAKRDYQALDKTVIILDPNGVMSLMTTAFIVWLDLPEDILITRAWARSDNDQDIKHRFDEHREEFENFRKSYLYDMQFQEEVPVEFMANEIMNCLNN